MVIERYKAGCFEKVYARYNSQGRLLPDGLAYLNSWVNEEKNICFQLMETNTFSLFKVWTERWEDLVDFEIVPVD
jgi:hypothetical protein